MAQLLGWNAIVLFKEMTDRGYVKILLASIVSPVNISLFSIKVVEVKLTRDRHKLGVSSREWNLQKEPFGGISQAHDQLLQLLCEESV